MIDLPAYIGIQITEFRYKNELDQVCKQKAKNIDVYKNIDLSSSSTTTFKYACVEFELFFACL